MTQWHREAVFYHIYPLGFCGAPLKNDFSSEPFKRLEKVYDWIEHIKYIGANTILFGPVFESATHGYDVADYYRIDRRLGDNETFIMLVRTLHKNGIKVVIDGVFNHAGRDFFAFRDLLDCGRESEYCDWFCNLDFEKKSKFNDPFDYETWEGYYRLVKLNHGNHAVKEYIYSTVQVWIEQFDIDGLRLDCADCLEFDFMSNLARLCRNLKSDFWIMGEVIHGDYSRWVNANMLDSVTNYICYKGLYSSHNDKNYFEIAYSLNALFGENNGLCKGSYLYNFTDNHDVNRIGSSLKNSAHLYPLHILLFTMPGLPSIYYGSEWGIDGIKHGMDEEIRPALELNNVSKESRNRDLEDAISKLAGIRRSSEALKHGRYMQLMVLHEQFAFAREIDDEWIIIIVNSSDSLSHIEFDVPAAGTGVVDVLNNSEIFGLHNKNTIRIDLYPCWGRILKLIR